MPKPSGPFARTSGSVSFGCQTDPVKVFVSSVVHGFEAERDAAFEAASALGHEVRRSEDFPATIESPQQACLAGVRWSDVVVLLLGGRYGPRQESGLSATQEEYEEAKGTQRILAFVQAGVDREPTQAAFIELVRGWVGGAVTGSFESPDELAARVTRSLHELELSMSAGPLDEDEMRARALALIPDRSGYQGGQLVVATAFGPRQSILSPKALEDADLVRNIHQEALLGGNAIFDTHAGVDSRVQGSALTIGQPDALVLVDQAGDICLNFPAVERDTRAMLPALVEEDLHGALLRALRLTAWIADRIDPTTKLTHVAPVVALLGGNFLGWRTREEQSRHPNEMTISITVGDRVVVELAPAVRPRQSLAYDAAQMAEDFVVLLRREYK
jgi:hypothetical protein